MTYQETAAFVKDLQKVLKKHGMMSISGPSNRIEEAARGLEGYHFFFTKGEKKLSLRGGEHFNYPCSITFKLQKNRFKSENTEDDGN